MRDRDLILATHGMRAVLVGGVVVSHWFGEPNAETYRLVGDAERAAAKRVGKRLGSLSFVEPGMPMGSASSVRGPAVELVRGRQEYLHADAVVFESEGFLASIMRSALAGYQLLSKGSVAQKVFPHRREGVEWLAARMVEVDQRIDAQQLARQLDELVAERARG